MSKFTACAGHDQVTRRAEVVQGEAVINRGVENDRDYSLAQQRPEVGHMWAL